MIVLFCCPLYTIVYEFRHTLEAVGNTNQRSLIADTSKKKMFIMIVYHRQHANAPAVYSRTVTHVPADKKPTETNSRPRFD